MYERGFAAAWEDFRSTEHMKSVRKGDMILMYANLLGIIGVGKALGEVERLRYGHPDRVAQLDTTEWRIPVKWLQWSPDNPCPWKPHLNPTFIDLSAERYARRLGRVRNHFSLMLK